MSDTHIEVNGSGRSISEVKGKEVDRSVTTAYIWRTGKTFYLSKKEWIVADTYLKTRNYRECERMLRKEGFNFTWQSCRRWLMKGHIQEWLMEKVEESGVYAGWTKERWFKVMTDHLQGKEGCRLKDGDLYGMNLIAKYKGWEQPSQFNTNLQINFTERG